MLRGIGVSEGIEIEKVLIFVEQDLKVNTAKIETNQIKVEFLRVEQAINKTINNLKQIISNGSQLLKDEKEIFKSHLMLLDDKELLLEIQETIEQSNITADLAIKHFFDAQVEIFENLEDGYMRARAEDLKDIGKQVLANSLGIKQLSLCDIKEKCILVAKDLTPSQIVQINKKYIKGFITENGSYTSHASIMARSLEIVSIVGVNDLMKFVRKNDTLILDSLSNKIILNPSNDKIKIYQKKKKEFQVKKKVLTKFIPLSSQTKDGVKIKMLANAGDLAEINVIKNYNLPGIGLFRTEFLFMHNKTLPTETDQFNLYKELAENLDVVIIRTLDIGGDKNIPYLNIKKEENPFLGWRAIRYCFDNEHILKSQLRAILKASKFGNLKIMFPMVVSIEEVDKLNEILNDCKHNLKNEGEEFNQNIEIGIMIETPSASLMANKLAKHVDFFSIGSNDLIQYTLAVDRGNEKVAYIYNSYHPAIIKSVSNIIEAAHNNKIWVSVCGEMAGDVGTALILCGMGVDELSLSPSLSTKIKQALSKFTNNELKELKNQILQADTIAEVKKVINQFIA